MIKITNDSKILQVVYDAYMTTHKVMPGQTIEIQGRGEPEDDILISNLRKLLVRLVR